MKNMELHTCKLSKAEYYRHSKAFHLWADMVKSGNFGHQANSDNTFANSGNPYETDFHCLLS